MNDLTLTGLENLFLALSDKTRLRLLALMAVEDVAVGELADSLGESQPKISRHLAYLRNSGLVSTRRDGKWVYYGIAPQLDPYVGRVFASILSSIVGDQVAEQIELRTETEMRNIAEVEIVKPNYREEEREMDIWLL